MKYEKGDIYEGHLKTDVEMVKDYINLKLVRDMMENGKIVKEMVKVKTHGQVDCNMMENGQKIKEMVLVHKQIKMVKRSLVCGKMMYFNNKIIKEMIKVNK